VTNDPELIRDIEDLARLTMRYPGWDFVIVTTAKTLGPKIPGGRTMWNQLERDVFAALEAVNAFTS
jgi:TRAP-type mannitol/chloroaromatic compound transport system substrate-binding protein